MGDSFRKTLKALLETESLQIRQRDKLFHLLEETTEITDNFILWLIDYCDKHQIPFLEQTQLKSYIKLSRQILKETRETITDLKSNSPPFLQHRKRTPEDATEPNSLTLM